MRFFVGARLRATPEISLAIPYALTYDLNLEQEFANEHFDRKRSPCKSLPFDR